ncbi:hypothetical protein Lalb_Chr07g0194351 [Lupinus albus]|uniref:Uncharacterized protein n=1 Tax=Lupinus albus TaxID=3870 RepID=A0A6A4QCY1_LUPAL|nr:hypothetical protein Lalb_Chr07g0194351 [Lupinus albus]
MVILCMENSMYLHQNTLSFVPSIHLRYVVPTRRGHSSVRVNHPLLFHVAVEKELKLLAFDREAAFSHMNQLSFHSHDETLLHRFLTYPFLWMIM